MRKGVGNSTRERERGEPFPLKKKRGLFVKSSREALKKKGKQNSGEEKRGKSAENELRGWQIKSSKRKREALPKGGCHCR